MNKADTVTKADVKAYCNRFHFSYVEAPNHPLDDTDEWPDTVCAGFQDDPGYGACGIWLDTDGQCKVIYRGADPDACPPLLEDRFKAWGKKSLQMAISTGHALHPTWHDDDECEMTGCMCKDPYAVQASHKPGKVVIMDKKNADNSYYNEEPPVPGITLIRDVANVDLVNQLVHKFVIENRFEKLLKDGCLDNVTPAAWRNQVNNAAVELETRLIEVLEHINEELHEGEFSQEVVH